MIHEYVHNSPCQLSISPSWQLSRTGANRYEDRERRERCRRTACDREKVRLQDMNRSFEQLRARVPGTRRGRRTSKIESLQLASSTSATCSASSASPRHLLTSNPAHARGATRGAGGTLITVVFNEHLFITNR